MSTHKKLLLMLSVFICLACVIGSVAAADVDDAVIVDSDSDSIAIDDAVIDDAGAYIPYIPLFPVNDTETIAIDVNGNAINNDSSIDYRHLPVGTTIKIEFYYYIPEVGLILPFPDWGLGNCTGVELIKNYTTDDYSHSHWIYRGNDHYEIKPCGYTKTFVFKVTDEDYNILLNDILGFYKDKEYNFNDKPFDWGAKVTIINVL